MYKLTRAVSISASSLAMLALSAMPVASAQAAVTTATPIKHVVVIFQENVSFDHYFGTYPKATNPSHVPPFYPAPGTPSVNGLTKVLLNNNPNSANPQRLGRAQAQTDDMDHGYTAEQKAFNGGLMNKFVENTGQGSWPKKGQSPSTVMDYYDGNTVTAMWNYAQHFAMSDNSYDTEFGPSSPGAIDLISGQTHGAVVYSSPVTGKQMKYTDKGYPTSTVTQSGTLVSDIDPFYDKASKKGPVLAMTGKNIGNLLNAKNVTWGWFEGGFANNSASHKDVGGISSTDYIPHHEPFQYYKSTANPQHLPPSSTAMIGHTDKANHQYDMTDFWKAADAGNMPAVSFLKAPAYEDGHAGYSTPLDGQRFMVNTINRLEKLPSWKNTAVIINYDDSDGWYDHQMSPIVNGSSDTKFDALNGPGKAGEVKLASLQDRAGYGARLPLVVISPYAKHNYVANTVTDQTSILRFIEDNWKLGQIGNGSYDELSGSIMNMFDFAHPSNRKVFLDPTTGEPISQNVAPFVAKGQTYMSMSDLAQSLDVNFTQSKDEVLFTYNGHQVSMPMHGSDVTVDGQRVNLGAPMKTVKGAVTLPIDSLAKALGVQPVKYQSSILFKPLG